MTREIDDFKNLDLKEEGRLGMKVIDSQDRVKNKVEYRREAGEGSVEANAKPNAKPKTDLPDAVPDFVWRVRRRDK